MTGIIVVVLASCLVTSILISIFFRYVVARPLSWPEEVSMLLFTWLVLLGGSLGVKEKFHVRLSILTSRLPDPIEQIWEHIVTIAIGGFGAVLMYSGYDLVNRTAEHLSATLRYPLDWLNSSAPVCGVLIVLHSLNNLLESKKEG